MSPATNGSHFRSFLGFPVIQIKVVFFGCFLQFLCPSFLLPVSFFFLFFLFWQAAPSNTSNS